MAGEEQAPGPWGGLQARATTSTTQGQQDAEPRSDRDWPAALTLCPRPPLLSPRLHGAS